MSVRSTMDLGLAALTAPSESSSVVGVVAAVGAAVAGLAVLGAALVDTTSWPHVSVPRVVTRNAASLSSAVRIPEEIRRRIDWGVKIDRLLNRHSPPTTSALPWSRRGFVEPDSPAASWAEQIQADPSALRVLADKLMDEGDQAGEVLAYEIDKVPYVNVLPPKRVEEEDIGDWSELVWQFRHLPEPGQMYQWPRILADELGADGMKLVREYEGQEFRHLVPTDYVGSYRHVPCLSASYPSDDSVDVFLYRREG